MNIWILYKDFTLTLTIIAHLSTSHTISWFWSRSVDILSESMMQKCFCSQVSWAIYGMWLLMMQKCFHSQRSWAMACDYLWCRSAFTLSVPGQWHVITYGAEVLPLSAFLGNGMWLFMMQKCFYSQLSWAMACDYYSVRLALDYMWFRFTHTQDCLQRWCSLSISGGFHVG